MAILQKSNIFPKHIKFDYEILSNGVRHVLVLQTNPSGNKEAVHEIAQGFVKSLGYNIRTITPEYAVVKYEDKAIGNISFDSECLEWVTTILLSEVPASSPSQGLC